MENKDLLKYIKYYLYFGTEESANLKYFNGKEKDQRIIIAKIIILFLESVLGLFCFAFLPILLIRLLNSWQ